MLLLKAANNLLRNSFSIKGVPKSIIQQTFRYKNDFYIEKLKTTTERDFLRKVIASTEGCSICTPSQVLEPNVMLLQRDELIKKLINLTRKFLLNRYEHKSNEKIVQDLLPQLHRDCIAQSREWSVEKNLFVMDIWKTYLDQPNEQLFFYELMDRYLNEIHSLPDPIALQIMYYAACGCEWKSNFYCEKNILQKMNKMMQDNKTPFNHMAVYCLALFKNGPEIGSVKFMRSFLEYLLKQDFDNEECIAVSCTLKMARKYATVDHIHQIEPIQSKLIPYAKHCDLISLTHVIQFGQKQRVFNRQLLELVLNRFDKNIDKIRGKDMERCMLSIATFDFESSSRIEERFCEEVLEYFKGSQEERKDFPESSILCITYLTAKGFYDETLLKWALEMPCQKNAAIINWKYTLKSNLLTLDGFVKINLANSYRGPVLSNDLVSKFAEQCEPDYNEEFLVDLKNIFDQNGYNYMVCQPMPHSDGPNLFFVYNKRTNRTVRVNLPVDRSKILNAKDLHQNDPDLKVVALVVCSRLHTIFRSNKYSGFFQMKLNQLKSLGFEVVVFRKRDWNKNLDLNLKQWYLTLQLYKQNIFLFNHNK